MMNPDIIKMKMEEYENFLEKLNRDLRSIAIILNNKVAQCENWGRVKEITRDVRQLKKIYSDMSDLERTYINIGVSYEYILEMDCDEIDKHANIQLKLLWKEIEHFRKLAADEQVKFKEVLLSLNELQLSLLPLLKENQNKH